MRSHRKRSLLRRSTVGGRRVHLLGGTTNPIPRPMHVSGAQVNRADRSSGQVDACPTITNGTWRVLQYFMAKEGIHAELLHFPAPDAAAGLPIDDERPPPIYPEHEVGRGPHAYAGDCEADRPVEQEPSPPRK